MKILTVFFLGALCLQTSFAESSRPYGRKGGGAGLMRMVRDLDLTQEQKAKLKDVAQKNGDRMKLLKEEMRSLFPKIHESMQSENFDASEAKKLHERQKQINSELSDLRFQQMLDLREILSPAQRKKLGEKMKDRGGRLREKRSNRVKDSE